jgi:hypothetical protein
MARNLGSPPLVLLVVAPLPLESRKVAINKYEASEMVLCT